MGAKEKELEPVSIKIAMSTAARLRKVTERHNLCRDAFVNYLIACIRGEDKFLKGLGFATRVHDVHRQAGVEDMPTSPLKAIEVSLSDPLHYMRNECWTLYSCGLYAMELPATLHGLACYLPDEQVPGTPARAKYLAVFDLDLSFPSPSPSASRAGRPVRGVE